MAQQTLTSFCTREAVRDTFYGFQGKKWQMKRLWERRQRPRAGTTTRCIQELLAFELFA